ncbi:MAG: hypothetical protein ACQETH_17775 [Candidatus Rifleibacteriota bacterium]
MIRSVFMIIGGTFLIFALTNIFLPQHFGNSILAAAATKLNLRSSLYQTHHFIIKTNSGDNNYPTLQMVRNELSNRLFAYNHAGLLISGVELEKDLADEALRTEPVLFLPYKATNLKESNRIVEATLYPRTNEKFPIMLAIFEVDNENKIKAITRPVIIEVRALKDIEEMTTKLAKFIAISTIF